MIFRSLVLVFAVLLVSNYAVAQYGNEWIRYDQPYFKIPTARDGIYKLTYADLTAAGFPISSDYNTIQLFHRGVEQAIAITKANPGNLQLEPGDYIEFYGQKNSGIGDKELYQPQTTQPHAYYNLFSDTTAYFLTVNSLGQSGKRMEFFNEANAGLPAENFHTDEKLLVLTTDYATGIRYNEGGVTYVQNTEYETGEGWTGQLISQGGNRSYTIEGIASTAVAYGIPYLEVQLMGRTRGAHPAEIWVGPTSGTRLAATVDFSEYNVVTLKDIPLQWSDIGGDGKIVVQVRALSTGSTAFRLSTSYIRIRYPQELNMGGALSKTLVLQENVLDKSYVTIQNFPANAQVFDVTDPAAVRRIGTSENVTLSAVVNNTSKERRLLVTNEHITPSIKKIFFRNINPSLHDFIIISHSMLMKPGGGYDNPVKAYAEYRASTEGGLYDTLTVDVRQLYNQFNYGEVSSLAIRRFMKYMVEQGSPRYLFLIGKGLELRYGYHRNPTNPSLNGFHDLIPIAGTPAGDVLYTIALGNTEFEPAVPTGRITASKPEEVSNYLNKVKQMEALPYDALWRKEVLHISGGLNVVEQGFFKNILQAVGENAKDLYLGGKVSAIAKNSPELTFINISEKINSGVNLVTLFGHSGTSIGEIHIGFASAPELGYNNSGKYPMFLLNGCSGGDFFATETRYGEDWIMAPNKGAIGFIASTGFGFTDALSAYSNTLYQVAYGDSVYIKTGIGDIQRETTPRLIGLLTEESDTVKYSAQAHQMFLLGDPAVKLFGAPKPDYETNDNSVFIESLTSEPVTALSDSFAIKVVIRNFGRAKEDSVHIRVTRTLVDNSVFTYDSLYAPVHNSDTLTFVLFKEENGAGENSFLVEVDPYSEINELSETNNTTLVTYRIPLNVTRNLYPQNFAIINTPVTELLLQSTDLLGAPRDFTIELDTVNTFDSPYKQSFMVNGKLPALEVSLVENVDTLAYYWRSKLTSPSVNESSEWVTSTFTYIANGPEGWAQVHFPQYYANSLTDVSLDTINRKIYLNEVVTEVSVSSIGSNVSGYTVNGFGSPYHPDVTVRVGGVEYHPISLIEANVVNPCWRNSVNFVAINKNTTSPYIGVPAYNATALACGRRPEVIASFNSSNIAANIGTYINSIVTGDSLFIFAVGNPGVSTWSSAVRTKLEEVGISAVQLNSIIDGEPFIIFGKKGAPVGTSIIYKTSTAPPLEQELFINRTVTGRVSSGKMISSLIGPAIEWNKVYTNVEASEFGETDEVSFDILGKKLTGEEVLLKTGLLTSEEDISDINAVDYPFIKVVFNTEDEINLTSAQLNKWIVAYTPAPEGVLIHDGSAADPVQEGAVWADTFSFKNISSKEFSDSLRVEYSLYNTTSQTKSVYSKRIKAPLPGEQTDFQLTASSTGKAGFNDLSIDVNPRVLPEVYYENNKVALKNYLEVWRDQLNPLLDVTIDGRYVMNGDFVSANPSIRITLWDENILLLKEDTIGMEILLQYPGQPFTRINFSSAVVQWFPATATTDFKVEFNPVDLPAGLYTMIISGTDASGNEAGEYEITFNVSEENGLRLVRPYPNPSKGQFVFSVVVEGEEFPDALQIEIVNANGKSVAAFTKREFFTGTNRFYWDTGALMPNGLYYYRATLLRGGKIVKTSSGGVVLNRE